MKIEVFENKKKFIPITISINLENVEDLDTLAAMLGNVQYSSYDKLANKKECMKLLDRLHSVVRQELEKTWEH